MELEDKRNLEATYVARLKEKRRLTNPRWRYEGDGFVLDAHYLDMTDEDEPVSRRYLPEPGLEVVDQPIEPQPPRQLAPKHHYTSR